MPSALHLADPGLVPDHDVSAVISALSDWRTGQVEGTLRSLLAGVPGGLPPIRMGKMSLRLRSLAEVAAVDLSLGRLYEGHEDARSIASEIGFPFRDDLAWGVWAAGGSVVATQSEAGYLLEGERHYCSGAGILDTALVTASFDGESRLFVVDAKGASVTVEAGSWPATGMAASRSGTVRFADAPARIVGCVDAYEQRPGFWAGSLNVAACWYGGALGLYRWTAANRGGSEDRASLGALRAEVATMRTVLLAAAQEVDSPVGCDDAFTRAMVVRHAIHDGCRRVLGLCERLGGSDAIARDADQSRRFADLPVYLSQHRPFRDLGSIAPSRETAS